MEPRSSRNDQARNAAWTQRFGICAEAFHKTVDTAGTSWFGEMQSHIRDLGTRGATVNGQPANMILDLRMPPGGTSAATPLIKYGQQFGVDVIVNEGR